MSKRKRSIWELTGLNDDIIWYAKRQRTNSLLQKLRIAVEAIKRALRPYYMLVRPSDGPDFIAYKSLFSIKRDFALWGGVEDYRGGVIRHASYYV